MCGTELGELVVGLGGVPATASRRGVLAIDSHMREVNAFISTRAQEVGHAELANIGLPGRTRPAVPAGMLGPDPVTADVHCFLVPQESLVLLADNGTPGSQAARTAGLTHIGAGWRDVIDVVLTHAHFDHTAGLHQVLALAPPARVWAGGEDIPAVDAGERPIVALKDGDHLRSLTVFTTPATLRGTCRRWTKLLPCCLSVTWSGRWI